MISKFLLGHGGKNYLDYSWEKNSICFVVFFWKDMLYGMAQRKERVSDGQYSKKMLSTIVLLICNTLIDGLMHAWPANI